MQAPPLLGRAVSSIMKICTPLIGFIIEVKYFLPNAMFIYDNKNGDLQECLAAVI